jgi:hypothetical protein
MILLSLYLQFCIWRFCPLRAVTCMVHGPPIPIPIPIPILFWSGHHLSKSPSPLTLAMPSPSI